MDIKQILEQAGKDILTEETLASIQKAVETIVEKKVEERSKMVTESALEEQDTEHGEKAQRNSLGFASKSIRSGRHL